MLVTPLTFIWSCPINLLPPLHSINRLHAYQFMVHKHPNSCPTSDPGRLNVGHDSPKYMTLKTSNNNHVGNVCLRLLTTIWTLSLAFKNWPNWSMGGGGGPILWWQASSGNILQVPDWWGGMDMWGDCGCRHKFWWSLQMWVKCIGQSQWQTPLTQLVLNYKKRLCWQFWVCPCPSTS